GRERPAPARVHRASGYGKGGEAAPARQRVRVDRVRRLARGRRQHERVRGRRGGVDDGVARRDDEPDGRDAAELARLHLHGDVLTRGRDGWGDGRQQGDGERLHV